MSAYCLRRFFNKQRILQAPGPETGGKRGTPTEVPPPAKLAGSEAEAGPPVVQLTALRRGGEV